ncbi:MAG: GNAT family N-acetyltransferase, partial [Roseiflexaceae bacterium]|nr:GNAT family N-acetyltransferase [Roseiflexaceae bacterium]
MTNISIRHATPGDAELAAAMIRAAFVEQATMQPPSGALRETGASIAGRMALGGLLIAELAGQPVGCVCYELHEHHAHFSRLAVLPTQRGRGIARALVEAVE